MRLVLWLCVFLLLPVGDAWADYEAVPKGFMCGSSGRTFDDHQQACQYISNAYSTPVPYPSGAKKSVAIGSYPGPYQCNWWLNPEGTGTPGVVSCTFQWFCPYGGTFTMTTKPMCIGADPPVNCPIGQKAEDWFPYNGNGKGFPICSSSGCAATATDVHTCMTLGSTGVRWCDIEGTLTGAKCNANTDNSQNTNYGAGGAKPSGSSTPSDLPPTKSGGKNIPCPKGSVQGGFDSDGIVICIGTGSDPQNPQTPPPVTTKPPVTVNNSDGSTTTTQQTVQQNSDGSTTTTTTTTVVGADGSKTVSQGSTTTNSTSGTPGKQDTTAADQANLCKQNPTLAICRNSSVSGDCTSGVVCTGDAIQCATLQAAQKLQCARQSDEDGLKSSASKTLGDAILGGTDPSKGAIDTLIKGDTADMSAPVLDQGGFVGGGACIPDKVFSVMGRTVTMSFAAVCSNIQPLRYAVMACAFILVYLMVARSVING
ncbi:virulence factor TspB C-terminal domain-related protein [Massilia sp. CT11-108]|uniref:virulence factor TspB C-terminal domain-related protein n=1 Tax=Massilia sp. CT11-108 TaxID=3393900 RepID=UPI0039A730FC